MKKPLLMGYLESWAPNTLTFTEAAQKGYTGIAMAFGTITGTDIGIYDNTFNPSPTIELLKEDLVKAKQAGAQELLFSVGGGENNTYNPNNATPEALAKALVTYCKDLGFTGVDFDIEIETDGDYLNALCAAIKAIDSCFTLTAAPQINQGPHESDLILVSTGNHQIYNQAIKNNYFDYLFVQAYNNPWPRLQSYTEKDVAFIAVAFDNLKKSIPSETLFAIGEPASKIAAGEYSIYHGDDANKDIYQLMQDQYRSIMNDPQYGGAMTWSIHLDERNGFKFLNAMQSVVTNTTVSSIS